MSVTALSTIQEEIERTLFHRIRQEVVDKGYLPDVADDITYPDTDPGYAQWQSDIDTIVTNMGYAIEIFSAGASESRGVKKIPRIVLNSGSFLPGALGGDPQRYFLDQTTHYQALVTPPQTVDFYADVHLVANTQEQIRILTAILALSIPRRGYIPFNHDSSISFFARNLGYYDGDNEDEGIIEKVYGYEIPDCWDANDVEAYDIIAKINEITLNTNLQKYQDGSWGSDSDSLIIT